MSEEAQNLPEDTGLLARLVTSPVAWVFTALLVAAVVAARGLFGAGTAVRRRAAPGAGQRPGLVAAAPLAPTTTSASARAAPAAPYVLPLAVVGTVLLGKAWLVVDLLFLLAVPLAALGAYRFLLRRHLLAADEPVGRRGVRRAAGRHRRRAGGPSRHGGRHPGAALARARRAVPRPRATTTTAAAAPRGARRCWLALLVAFVPAAWLLALLVATVALAVGLRGRGDQGLAVGVATPLVATLVLLLPWTVATWSHQGAASWLFEAGLPAPRLAPTGSPPGTRSPAGPGAAPPAGSRVGVAARRTSSPWPVRTPARPCCAAWTVLVVGPRAAPPCWPRGASRRRTPPRDQPLCLGFPLVVAQAAPITAAALAGTGIRRRLSGSNFGWRQPIGVPVVVLAASPRSSRDALVGLVRQRRPARPGPRHRHPDLHDRRRRGRPRPTGSWSSAAPGPGASAMC